MPVPVVDTHHHLWDADVLDYALLDGPLHALKGCYDAAVYDEVARGNGISASICVEAASAGAEGRAETGWLLAQAGKSSIVRGVVVWAPLGSGAAARYMDEVQGRAGAVVKGVRRSFEFAPADELASEGVKADAVAAGERGLSVDLVLFEASLPGAYRLARECEGTRFVLDHLGKPNVGRRTLGPWGHWVAAMGELDNVVCKISGLAVEAHDPNWSVEQLVPFLDTARESFGAGRLMFGTDWPVCDLAGGLDRWASAMAVWTAGWTDEERHQFYGQNATSFWDLGPGLGGM